MTTFTNDTSECEIHGHRDTGRGVCAVCGTILHDQFHDQCGNYEYIRRGNYPFAYGRLRALVDLAIYDLDHGHPRERVCDQLRYIMDKIESELKGEIAQ